MPQVGNTFYHAKDELPCGGYLNLAWDRDKKLRFLRAMDDGSCRTRVRWGNNDLRIVFYDELKFICDDGTQFDLKGYDNARN